MGATYDLLSSGADVRNFELRACEDTKVGPIFTLVVLKKIQVEVSLFYNVSLSSIHCPLVEVFPEKQDRSSLKHIALNDRPFETATLPIKRNFFRHNIVLSLEKTAYIMLFNTENPLLFLRENTQSCQR
ncbi:hypothetical protein RCL1_007458 [Eukaryota sp. TZLM3-RCL]